MDSATFQGIGQGLNQGISNGFNMGMRLREQAAIDRHRQVLEEQTKAQTAVANIQLEERRKLQEDYERPMDLTTMPMYLSMPDEVKPQVLKYYSDNGYTDANGRGKKGDILKGAGNMAATKELFQGFMEPVVKAKQATVLGAWNELQEVKAAGDEKKIQVAQAKYNKLNADYQSSVGKFDEHLKMITQHDLKMEEEQNKKKPIAFSGGSSFDAETGEPIYQKPPSTKRDDPETKSDKAIDKADKRIKGIIDGYDAQIAIFEKKLAAAEKAEDDKAIKRWTDSIDNFQQEKSKAINTQNQLRNGTLPPDKIMWGGDKGNSTGTYKTADDVKAAFKSGKIKEVEAVKILKDKFGMK